MAELLPPRGDELATRADIRRLASRMDALEQTLTARVEALEHRLGARIDQRVSAAVTTQTRTLVLSQLAALVTIATLAFGLR